MTSFTVNKGSESWLLQDAVWLTARMPVDWDMIKQEVKGEKIGSLPSLWPFDYFRKAAIDGAQRFVGDMAKMPQGYELVGNQSDVQVWAPVRPRTYKIDAPMKANIARARIDSEGDWPYPQGQADIVFGAYFKAKYAAVIETGSLPQVAQDEEV